LAIRVACPPVLVDDTIALKSGVDARYHSYLRRIISQARGSHSAQDGFDLHFLAGLSPPAHYDVQFTRLLCRATRRHRSR
jgi:hypothetical protein